MNETISVIVPIFNVELYLKRCVDSILAQTYKNLEIILVDDESPDACGAICDDYANMDERVRVIHQKNGGLSAARNAGLDIATGAYIGFVDSDDYILPEMYEKLLNACVKADADMSICRYQRFDEDDQLVDTPKHILHDEVVSRDEFFDRLVRESLYLCASACVKLYAYKLFEQLRFPIGKLHEDEYLLHHVLDKCSKIALVGESLYMRLINRSGSIMSGGYYPERLDQADAFLDRYHFFWQRGMANNSEHEYRRALRSANKVLANGDAIQCLRRFFPVLWKAMVSIIINRDFRLVMCWPGFFLRSIRNLFSSSSFRILFTMHYIYIYIMSLFTKQPPIILLGTPTHGNLGDSAIAYAERLFIKDIGKHRSLIEVSKDNYIRFHDFIRKSVHQNDIIVIDGGGSIGALWSASDNTISEILSSFKENRIFIFPQTCYYNLKGDVPSARLRSAQKIYSEAKALTLMLREKESYDFCKKYHPTTDIELMPDIALSITDAPTTQNRDGVLLCFRDDKERVLSEADRTAVISALRQINNDIETKEISTHIHRRVTKRTRKKELFALWNQFAASKLVITDRLHGMIFAAITGTPCIALNNLSKKVEGVYRLVHEEIPYISFMENTDHAKAMISAALAQPSTKYEYKYPIDRLYAIFSGTNIGTHPSTTHGGTING